MTRPGSFWTRSKFLRGSLCRGDTPKSDTPARTTTRTGHTTPHHETVSTVVGGRGHDRRGSRQEDSAVVRRLTPEYKVRPVVQTRRL